LGQFRLYGEEPFSLRTTRLTAFFSLLFCSGRLSLFFCSIDASHLHSEIQAKTNLLFEAHQAHRLSLLGPAPSPTTSSPDEIARYAADKEKVLAEFYRDWIHANKDRQARWVWEWWADVREDVGSGLRKGLKRLFG
jgi:hypothetical protein